MLSSKFHTAVSECPPRSPATAAPAAGRAPAAGGGRAVPSNTVRFSAAHSFSSRHTLSVRLRVDSSTWLLRVHSRRQEAGSEGGE
jgi:hypothetical protein